jgi:hypothetical protein
MHPLSPVLLIAAASASAGVSSDASGIRFINHCGFRSHFDHASKKSSWPLPQVANCDALAAYAYENNILMDEPLEGDVFLSYSRIRRQFVRAGVVASIDCEFTWRGRSIYLCTTVEDGVSRGRTLSPGTGDRFVRWVEMEWRRHAA